MYPKVGFFYKASKTKITLASLIKRGKGRTH